MIQVYLLLAQQLITGFLILIGLTFGMISINRFRKKKNHKIFLLYTLICLASAFLIFNINLTSTESDDRNKTSIAFKQTFGFEPPSEVEVIKHKQYALYDSEVDWFAFSLDLQTYGRITTFFKMSNSGTPRHQGIVSSIKQLKANEPSWFEYPNPNSNIMHGEDFKGTTNSDCYAWANESMMYVLISAHD